jgi:hypothetical protein
MAQSYTYPPGFSTVSIPAVGSNGSPIPLSSILIAGENPSNDLTPVQVDSSGHLIVSPLTTSSIVKAQLQDNNGNPVLLGQTTMDNSLPVTIASNQSAISVTGGGNFTVVQSTGTNLHTVIDSGTISATQSGTWNITNISGTVSLPTGASTSANQTTANSSLSTIATNTTGLNSTITTTSSAVPADAIQIGVKNGSNLVPITEGQSTMANSLPVVIASDQSSIPISGTITAMGSGNFTVVQPTGTNLHTVVDSGTITANIGTTNGLALDTSVNGILVSQGSTTSGEKGPLIQAAVTTSSPSYTTAQTSPLSLTTAGALRVDASATTQPISGTVTANAGTGNFTVVQGTGTNLHTVVDSGTITANQGTANATPWNENIAQFGGSAVVTGTGASGSGIPRVTISNDSSLAANQSVNLNQVGGSSVTLGSKTSANSIPVVIASDQAAVAVKGSLSPTTGRSFANTPVQNIYSSTNITTGAYVQLVSSTTSTTNYLDIFDSSGQAMILGVGGSGSEVIQAYIPPGGDQIPLAIPSGSRVAYKALSANATSGYLLMNFYT